MGKQQRATMTLYGARRNFYSLPPVIEGRGKRGKDWR
jgi:hypothetical protein